VKSSIKTKLICGCLLILLIPTIIIFVIVYSEFSRQAYTGFTKSATSELRQAGRAIATFLNEAELNANLMAVQPALLELGPDSTSFVKTTSPTKPFVKEGDAPGAELMRFFEQIRTTHPSYIKVYAGTQHGAFIISSPDPMPAGYDPRARPWYKETQAGPDKPMLSKAYRDTQGQPMISATRAYKGASGKLEGIVALDITLGQLTEVIKNIKLGQTGWVILIQSDGTIISNPKDPETNFKNISELWGGKLKDIQGSGSDQAGSEVEADGKAYIVSVHVDPDTGWKYAGVIEKAELTEPVRRTVGTIALVMGVGLIVMGAAIWLFSDYLVIRPLTRVESFLNAVAGGNYGRREQHVRGDEIGRIFNALNNTADQLGENMREIEAKTKEAQEKAQACQLATDEAVSAQAKAESARAEGMLEAAGQLETVVERLSSATDDLKGHAEEILRGTEVQRERIHSTATAMVEMNATVLEVAKNASHASRQGLDAKDKASHGASVVATSLDAMKSSREQAQKLKANMSELDHQAKAIGAIINVIQDIADQTNLLALNAAIEAARAGEAGRGFAVVADEVRKLAEKTMTATKEVSNSITAIQGVAAMNVAQVEAAVSELEKASDLANQSGSALGEIVKGTEESAGQIQSIAAAAEEQAAASEEINRAIEEINTIAQTTEERASETMAAVTLLVEQSRALSELIERLKSEAEGTGEPVRALSRRSSVG